MINWLIKLSFMLSLFF